MQEHFLLVKGAWLVKGTWGGCDDIFLLVKAFSGEVGQMGAKFSPISCMPMGADNPCYATVKHLMCSITAVSTGQHLGQKPHNWHASSLCTALCTNLIAIQVMLH